MGFQRDFDRVLYCTELRRLAGVTQVVSASEGHIFHNRLTHTLKVAQIGRRISELLLRENTSSLIERCGGLDPDVVAASGLAHDLGHPPFGHVAEDELDTCLRDEVGVVEGFNGNPQSFRIVTKLAMRNTDFDGLNLSRATLNAVLKYPRLFDIKKSKKQKWGAYVTEREEFEWARELKPPAGDRKSLEAEIMDWADDIAYAVHDVEDFVRGRLIPIDRLASDDAAERERFLNDMFARWERQERTPPFGRRPLAEALSDVVLFFLLVRPFEGTARERAQLRSATSELISTCVQATALTKRPSQGQRYLQINDKTKQMVVVLKELPWTYVIERPSLRGQQIGKRQIVRSLFKEYWHGIQAEDYALFPMSSQEQLQAVKNREADPDDRIVEQARIVADVITNMTDEQAVRMNIRLTGASLGSVLDPII